jgi:hypothetical protein
MIEAIESMLADMERGKLIRRQFAISLVATAAGVAATRGTLSAPPVPTELHIISQNHVTASVPDLLRTSEFYEQFFGMPLRKQHGHRLTRLVTCWNSANLFSPRVIRDDCNRPFLARIDSFYMLLLRFLCITSCSMRCIIRNT